MATTNCINNTSPVLYTGVGNYQVACVKISTQTASSSATINFTGLTSEFSQYIVIISDLAPATDAVDFLMRTSTNGGSTYDAGATDYGYALSTLNDAGTAGSTFAASDTAIILGTGLGNAANEINTFNIYIFNPSAANNCHIRYEGTQVNTTSNLRTASGAGRRKATADVDAIRFLMSSGNITSGKFTLYGLIG